MALSATPSPSPQPSGLANGSSRTDHLEFIRRAGQTTRRAITEHTGLSRSVVAQTISELIAQGLVVERHLVKTATAAGRASRGRPTAVLQVARQHGVIVAVDIGHNHITAAIVDLQSNVLTERRIDFAVDRGAAPTFAAVRSLVAASLADAACSPAEVCGFGVSFPFPVARTRESIRGTVRAPAHLTGWHGAEVAAVLPAEFSCPLIYDNDANFGAWGERMHGAARTIDDVLYVKLGHGIGSGLIVNGHLLSGARGVGGEMGHIQVDPRGRLCRCGRRGCLETVVADSLPDYHSAGRHVGRAIAQLCAFIDPELVVLGGQTGAVGEPLLAGVREAFAEFDLDPGMPVVPASLGPRSELVGIIDRTLTEAWASRHAGWHQAIRSA